MSQHLCVVLKRYQMKINPVAQPCAHNLLIFLSSCAKLNRKNVPGPTLNSNVAEKTRVWFMSQKHAMKRRKCGDKRVQTKLTKHTKVLFLFIYSCSLEPVFNYNDIWPCLIHLHRPVQMSGNNEEHNGSPLKSARKLHICPKVLMTVKTINKQIVNIKSFNKNTLINKIKWTTSL